MYGVELWGSTKPGNNLSIQSFQSKVPCTILNASWYVSNLTTRNNIYITKGSYEAKEDLRSGIVQDNI